MVRKGPPRSLAVVIDPSHKLIVDESDNRPQTGRIVLEAPQRTLLIPPSPAPGASFLSVKPNREHGRSSGSLGRRLGAQLAIQTQMGPGVEGVEGAKSETIPGPLSPSVRSEGTERSAVSSLDNSLLPATTSFASSLAARRRSSVVSLPPLPAASHSTTLRPPPRVRNDSDTSINSVLQSQNRILDPTREDSNRFTYLNSAASSTSNTALNSITMPAPYRNGPIQVLPGIWLGCEDNARDWEGLRRCGIGSVLNVAKEISNLFEDSAALNQDQKLAPPSFRIRPSISTPNLSKPPRLTFGSRLMSAKPAANLLSADPITGRPELHYLHLPWSHGQSDLVGNGFSQAMQFCDEAIQRGKGVLVHCQCGVSRSATLVIALVMRAASKPDATQELKSLGPSMNAAYDYVKQKSSCVGPNMSLIYQLLDYEKQLHPRPALSRTTSFQPSEVSSQVDPGNSPDEPNRHMSEEDRIREEEEAWARMRRQMEEEEEREREQSLREAGAGPLARPDSSFGRPVLGEALQVPWNNNSWSGFSLPLSNAAGTSRGSRSVADDEEAKGLDLAMEERQLRRKGSALSVASSRGSIGGGKVTDPIVNNGAAPTPFASWKARFGHRRLRAGSVESNVTGRSISMISVEEEDEAPEGSGSLAPPPSKLQTSLLDSGNGSRVPGLGVRPRLVSDASIGSKSVSDSASTSEASTDDASPNMDDDDADQYLTAPPLSSEGTTSSALLTTPLTPLSLASRKKNNGGKLKPALDIVDNSGGEADQRSNGDAFQSLRIVVEEATSMTTRVGDLVTFSSSPVDEDTSMSPTGLPPRLPPMRSMTEPPTFSFGPLPAIGRRASQALPPPSASAFKTSFGMNDMRAPPPSASHLKTSFGGDMELPFPRRPSSSASSNSGRRERSKSPAFSFSLPRARSRQKESALQTVPSSPDAMEDVTTSPSRKRPAPTLTRLSESTGISKSRMKFPSSSRNLDPSSVDPDVLMEDVLMGDGRKRARSKPKPLSLPSKPETPSSNALASYILSSSKRERGHRPGKSLSSSASNSSRSSTSTSRSSLRDQLLSRIANSSSPPPHRAISPPLATATPHQTLFIFPPSPTASPTKNQTSSLPSGTPSAFVLTTTFGMVTDGSSGPSPSAFPLLTPTPTLSTFVPTGRPSSNQVSRKSSVSSIPGLGNGGWVGAMPSNPTTACSRVDARGWVAR
ncbi:hypothetical protein FRB94_003818 [Tulasnella sp. JGI-2019a]|nr:hypothetical protein FRB94_003818 [Tulasnella sp. JGI-2019a]